MEKGQVVRIDSPHFHQKRQANLPKIRDNRERRIDKRNQKIWAAFVLFTIISYLLSIIKEVY
jgi:hypothetical protein